MALSLMGGAALENRARGKIACVEAECAFQ
jgi:hypothetical protein